MIGDFDAVADADDVPAAEVVAGDAEAWLELLLDELPHALTIPSVNAAASNGPSL